MTAPTLDELVAVVSGLHHRGATTEQAAGVLTDLTGMSPDLAAAMIHRHEQETHGAPAEQQTVHEPSDDWAWE